MMFNMILLGFILPVDLFWCVLKKYLSPGIFIISKKKISVYGRENYTRIFHSQMVVWHSGGIFGVLSDIFRCLQFVNSFCTYLYYDKDCTRNVLLSLEGFTTGLIWVRYFHLCYLGLLPGLPSVFMFLL